MSFDPEKVERLSAGDEELIPDPKGAFVWFRDYDQLLQLYREAKRDLATLEDCGDPMPD